MCSRTWVLFIRHTDIGCCETYRIPFFFISIKKFEINVQRNCPSCCNICWTNNPFKSNGFACIIAVVSRSLSKFTRTIYYFKRLIYIFKTKTSFCKSSWNINIFFKYTTALIVAGSPTFKSASNTVTVWSL